MAECALCKTETHLYEHGAPICMRCSEARDAAGVENKRNPPVTELKIREILRQEIGDDRESQRRLRRVQRAPQRDSERCASNRMARCGFNTPRTSFPSRGKQ